VRIHAVGARQGLRAVDLFSGAGGLSVGLKQAGFRVVAAIENDPVAVETYRRNHPEVSIFAADIRRVTGAMLLRTLGLKRGGLDLLAGCPPCQGFSRMRTRNKVPSVQDERNELIFQFLRLVRSLLPHAIMLENVPGLDNDSRIARFTEALSRLGYMWDKGVVDAADHGVPQRRKRLILVASRDQPVSLPSPTRWRRTVVDAIAALPVAGRSGDEIHDLPEHRAAHVMDLIRAIPKDGGSRTDLPRARQLPCHKRTYGFHDVYGRLSWNDVSPTITSGCINPSKGRFLHPEEDRALTLREAALLQTFPRYYWFSLRRGKEHAAAMIGNALPPRLIARVARTVRRAIRPS
jgi:DNA (cytosine-5)-methyltransferase 1